MTATGWIGVVAGVVAALTAASAPGAHVEQGYSGKPTYTLVAKMATYDVDLEYADPAKGGHGHGDGNTKVGHFEFLTRSWALDGELDDNMLGPLLELRPGQHFEILVENEMAEEGPYEHLGPPEPTASSWLPIIDQRDGPYVYPHGVDALGMPFFNDCTGKTPISEFAVDTENLPKNFNWTSLHVHGLEVVPHLFEPQGTADPKADYITIKPGGHYLYEFDLPEDHPSGTFWYHPHRHNSAAIQAWGALAGLIYVRGVTDDELKAYGVTRELPFVIHDPHYRIEKYPTASEPGIAKPATFLANQNETSDYSYLVTGKFRPTITLGRNEVARFRMLIATAENLAAFRIVPKDAATRAKGCNLGVEKENCPFWVMASDGITYDRPVQKDTLVGGGGERHDLLVTFSEPGDYEVWSDQLGHIQFFGTGPKDQLLATIHVTAEEAPPLRTKIADMRFTPGIPDAEDIRPEEIVRKRHVVFDLNGDTCKIPFPQFRINDQVYRTDEVSFSSRQGDAEEWVLINPNWATHPFHIHVNAFQVKEIHSALEPDPKVVSAADRPIFEERLRDMTTVDRPDQWRDTIVIPARGYLRVWTRLYSKYTGKTVFHCHFLAHEETGMIQNFLIEPREEVRPE